MSKYQLYLIPTVKNNAIIGLIKTSFSIGEHLFMKDSLYHLSDIKDVLNKNGYMYRMVNVQPMHLHLTDDKRTPKGDWIYDEEFDCTYKTENVVEYNVIRRRIICSTDTELVNTNEVIPNFHHAFIDHYMICNNRAIAITDNIVPEFVNVDGELKFLIKDNIMSVLIKVEKPEKTYSRAELDVHLLAVMNLGMGLRQRQLNGTDLRSGVEVLNEYKEDNF